MKKIIIRKTDEYKMVVCLNPDRIEIELPDHAEVEVVENAEPSRRISAI